MIALLLDSHGRIVRSATITCETEEGIAQSFDKAMLEQVGAQVHNGPAERLVRPMKKGARIRL